MKDHVAKQITREEARYLLLHHLSGLVDYWERESRAKTSLEKLEGFLHSLLVTLDGGSCGLPGYAIVPMEPQGDIDYSKEQGYDHYPLFEGEEDLPGDSYDIGGALHEDIYKYRNKEVKRPKNLYDFGAHLAEDARKMHERHPQLAIESAKRRKELGFE